MPAIGGVAGRKREAIMKKTVKVLQVLDYVNHNSGVSAVVMNYFSHMNHDRVQCDFLLFEKEENEISEEIVRRGGKIYTTGKPAGKSILDYRKRVDEFFAQHAGEYEVVHVHIPNAAFAVLRSAKKYGVPVRILHSHNARGADGTIKKVRNFLLNKWGILYANQYFACGGAAGVYLYGKRKVRNHQVQVLNNAIDLERYAFCEEKRDGIRRQYGIKTDEMLLGNVGRFAEQKNQTRLLEIFAEARRTIRAKLILLGDGELRSALEEKAQQLGIADDVIFAGVVDNVEAYLSAMDVFLLPSLYEGLPVVCVEAQAADLPCLVSATVTREIKLTDRVYFIENKETAQWCEMLEMLAHDGAARRSGMKLDEYDIKKQAAVLEEIYLQYGKSTDTDVHL